MPWVQRNESNAICGLYANKQEGYAEEFLSDGDPDVISFLTPASVPKYVTPRQARLALLHAGLLTQVEDAVKAADSSTQITWDYAAIINRDDPSIATLGAVIGLTAEQVDHLFIQAALL